MKITDNLPVRCVQKNVAAMVVLALAGLGNWVLAQSPQLTQNWYRIPYSTASSVEVEDDYYNHGGAYDILGLSQNLPIVAAAAGRVEFIDDSNNQCRCENGSWCGNNLTIIKHSNDEYSYYFHMVQWSSSGNGTNQAGLSVGDCVVQGQFIGMEGDVGYTCWSGPNHPNGSTNRAATTMSCDTDPQALNAPYCAVHLHWEVRRGLGGPRMQPKICSGNVEADNHILRDNTTYIAGFCYNTCPSSRFITTYYGGSYVFTAANYISSSGTAGVLSNGSVAFEAGLRVSLTPGFTASAGSYFEAKINTCGSTGLSCPPLKNDPTRGPDEPISIAPDEVKALVDVYPNPATDFISIDLLLKEESAVTMLLSDISGRTVRTLSWNERLPVGLHVFKEDVSELAPGMYFCVLQYGASVITRKIVKK